MYKDEIFMLLCALIFFLNNKDEEVFIFACLGIKQNKKGYYVDWAMHLIHNRIKEMLVHCTFQWKEEENKRLTNSIWISWGHFSLTVEPGCVSSI